MSNSTDFDYNNEDIKTILKSYIEYLKENPIQYCVSGLDYSSLYPSLIMTYNLSPEYLITDPNYKEEIEKKGYNIHNIKFTYNYENYLGEKNTKEIIAWTVRHNEQNTENPMFGLYPTILRYLFKQRSIMKKQLAIYKDKKEHIEKYETNYINTKEYKECTFKIKYYDTKQKALKVFMNIFYGETGNKTSPFFQLPLAGGVTSAGQYNLLLVKKYVEDLGHNVYYGDSVTGETPILIKQSNHLVLLEIQNYLNSYKFKQYNNGKEILNLEELNITLQEIYTENGWTKIKKIIRHRTNKKIYRIQTKTGIVNVTEDHSLLNSNKEKIKPEECKIGTKLLSWINKKDLKKDLNTLKNDLNLDYNKGLFYNYIYCKTLLEAQYYYLFYINNNYNVEIEFLNNKIYKLTYSNEEIENSDNIINIEFIGYTNNYVYDLETESHHFSAGLGNIVVHNTDSLYISCPSRYYLETDKEYYTGKISKEEYNTKLVLITFKAIEDIKIKVNNYLYENNGTKYLNMSYEEVLFPLAFLSKKNIMEYLMKIFQILNLKIYLLEV